MNYLPARHIQPFGLCRRPNHSPDASDPAGSLPPCAPDPAGPWLPGAGGVLVSGYPALNSASRLRCQKGGVIEAWDSGSSLE
jgi:hypothetical protein